MEIPKSIIDPAAAPTDATYLIAFEDDDWDHWDELSQAPSYLAQRSDTGRWWVRSLDGTPVDWDYADDEVILLEAR